MTLEILTEIAEFTKGYLSKVKILRKPRAFQFFIRIAKASKVMLSDIFGETERNAVISVIKKNEGKREYGQPI